MDTTRRTFFGLLASFAGATHVIYYEEPQVDILTQLRELYHQYSKGTNRVPQWFLVAPDIYERYESSLMANLRFVQVEYEEYEEAEGFRDPPILMFKACKLRRCEDLKPGKIIVL